MASLSNCIAMCSIHTNEVALAVCFNTKELLCFQCSLDKAHTLDKNIVKQIEKLSEESEKLLLSCILAKQKATRKQNLINDYKEKTKTIREDMNGQVRKMYDQLLEKLGKMRDNTLDSIETKYSSFLQTCNYDKKKLDIVTKTINEQLEKLASVNESDIDRFKAEIEEAMEKLDDIGDYESSLDGSFVAKVNLQEAFSMEHSFGEVNIFTIDHYEKPESVKSMQVENKSDPFREHIIDEPPKIPPKPSRFSAVSITSDEDYEEEKPKVIPRLKTPKDDSPGSENIPLPTKKRTSLSKEDNAKSTKSEANDYSKVEKPRSLLSFGPKDKKSANLQDYEDVQFVEDTLTHARRLINTTKSLSELPTQFRAPFKFSKLIEVGPRRVGLLSKEHSSIFVTGLDGKVQDSRTYIKNHLTSIVDMSDDMIAVLKNQETEIEIIQVSNGKLSVKNTLKPKLDISDFTGFDYSSSKSQFAIGTESQYVLLDKKGKTVKVKAMDATYKSSDTMTIFDFEKNNIFIINKTRKSMKCVAFKTMTIVWKRKCEDPLFQPEAAYLHQQQLCIASPHVITIFAAKDGEPERKHETDDLVKDCLGLCVLDDEVLVFSSKSNDFEESKKLTFVGL